MCYNCGCQMPNNDMGSEKNITNQTFETAATGIGQPVETAKKNAIELLEKVLASKEQSTEKEWKP